MESATEVLERAIAAHGGMALWRRVSALEVVASSSGFRFTLKRRPPQPRARLRVIPPPSPSPLLRRRRPFCHHGRGTRTTPTICAARAGSRGPG